jgi:hypothetical protein
MSQGSKLKFLWLVFFAGSLFLGNAWAGPTLKNTHIPADVYEGQAIRLKHVFEWPAEEGEYEFQFPNEIGLHHLQFLGQDQSKKITSSDLGPVFRLTLSYQILPSTAGQGSIDGFNVLYRKKDSATWNTLAVPSVLIDIKKGLSEKWILILISVLIAIALPFMIWVIRATLSEQKQEQNFKSDPKQQIYASSAKIFENLITGHAGPYVRSLTAEWSYEFTKVVMACYDLPVQVVGRDAIVSELETRNIPPEELHETKRLLDRLEDLKFATELTSSIELEKTRLLLLQYVKNRITVNPT